MNERIPYNQGIKAFKNNLGTNLNPYDNGDHRHNDWLLGYSSAEQGKSDLASVNVKYMMRVEDPDQLVG